jgi:hypothetical protein
MFTIRKAPRCHPWVVLEDRIIPERGPRRMLPDGPHKILLVVLLEELGLHTGGIVCWRNCRIVAVLDRDGNADGVSRVGFDLGEDQP